MGHSWYSSFPSSTICTHTVTYYYFFFPQLLLNLDGLPHGGLSPWSPCTSQVRIVAVAHSLYTVHPAPPSTWLLPLGRPHSGVSAVGLHLWPSHTHTPRAELCTWLFASPFRWGDLGRPQGVCLQEALLSHRITVTTHLANVEGLNLHSV